MALLVPAPVRAQADLRTSPKQYDAVRAEQNVMITMRDGTKLATDIWRPARNGTPVDEKFPVLLVRTPYDKNARAPQAPYFAERGYVVALQDIRGRYKSEGVFMKVQPKDATDGYDTIEWLAKQSYANGTVGMWGTEV